MPDMAVITRQHDDTPRLSGGLQQRPQRANSLDGPGIAELLGGAQAVVNRIDHDPYHFVLLRRNGVTYLSPEGSTTALRKVSLVVQDRRMAAVADRAQARTSGKVPLLVTGIATIPSPLHRYAASRRTRRQGPHLPRCARCCYPPGTSLPR